MNQVVDCLTAIWQTGRKIAFLGIGSSLRGDDAVGLYLVTALEKHLGISPERELQFYVGETAPENFSGVIRAFTPTNLIIFDAAELETPPGTFAIIDPAQIGGISFTTHTLPLNILIAYLATVTGCATTVIGIQPKSLAFTSPLSPEVKAAADMFVEEFNKRLRSL
jgi:hydrogenase 3 maturation protease